MKETQKNQIGFLLEVRTGYFFMNKPIFINDVRDSMMVTIST